MSTEYTPPTRMIWENVNNALDMVVGRCRELRAEINQLKEDKGLLRAAMMIESELLRRSELEVRQLKAEINQLKEKHKLLEDILNSQAEVDKRTRVERQNLRMSLHRRTDQVEQLKKEVAKLTAELNNPRYHYDCPF